MSSSRSGAFLTAYFAAVVAACFATGLDLATRRDGPVEERVIAGDALAARRFLDVLEEGREAAEELALVKGLGHPAELIERNARLIRPRIPQLAGDLFRRELALERGEHAPFELAQLDDLRVHDFRRLVRLAAGLDAAPACMADAEHEERLRGHDAIRVCADLGCEEVAMLLEGEALGDFEGRPEAVLRAGRF